MPHQILAIDDSIALRMFISKTLALRADEFVVTTARDGSEGIALATSGKPDLILLDMCARVCKSPARSPWS